MASIVFSLVWIKLRYWLFSTWQKYFRILKGNLRDVVVNVKGVLVKMGFVFIFVLCFYRRVRFFIFLFLKINIYENRWFIIIFGKWKGLFLEVYLQFEEQTVASVVLQIQCSFRRLFVGQLGFEDGVLVFFRQVLQGLCFCFVCV